MKLSPVQARLLQKRLEALKFKPRTRKWYEAGRHQGEKEEEILKGRAAMALNDLKERLNAVIYES